jgi:hypothetical protein
MIDDNIEILNLAPSGIRDLKNLREELPLLLHFMINEAEEILKDSPLKGVFERQGEKLQLVALYIDQQRLKATFDTVFSTLQKAAVFCQFVPGLNINQELINQIRTDIPYKTYIIFRVHLAPYFIDEACIHENLQVFDGNGQFVDLPPTELSSEQARKMAEMLSKQVTHVLEHGPQQANIWIELQNSQYPTEPALN